MFRDWWNRQRQLSKARQTWRRPGRRDAKHPSDPFPPLSLPPELRREIYAGILQHTEPIHPMDTKSHLQLFPNNKEIRVDVSEDFDGRTLSCSGGIIRLATMDLWHGSKCCPRIDLVTSAIRKRGEHKGAAARRANRSFSDARLFWKHLSLSPMLRSR